MHAPEARASSDASPAGCRAPEAREVGEPCREAGKKQAFLRIFRAACFSRISFFSYSRIKAIPTR